MLMASGSYSGASVDTATELTILMPCLNEAETLATCVRKALAFLQFANVAGEVLVADNGSTDGSVDIAEAAGARTVRVPTRGYGAALLRGIEAAHGRYVIMGDADDSYDFFNLAEILNKLRARSELVMGNRFRGGIACGAMPFLHRYLGNPVLSLLGRMLFRVPVGDFHCGLRGFDRERMLGVSLGCSGMEFASEMVVKAKLHGLSIAEVPVALRPDGRSRPPHLRTWTDGWRHLKFLLLHSPRWLFFYPGSACFSLGLLLAAILYSGPVALTPNLHLDVHSFVMGCMLMLLGAQGMSFALIARRYAARVGILPTTPRIRKKLWAASPDRMLLIALLLFMIGAAGLAHSAWIWAQVGFGNLYYGSLVKSIVLSGVIAVVGLQLVFTAFLSALLDSEPAVGEPRNP